MTEDRTVVHVRPDEGREYPTAERVRILESWNTHLDGDVSIARARLAPGESSEVHWLEAVDERFVILSGSATLDAGDVVGRPVAPGDVVFVPAGTRQRFHNTGAEDLVFLCICTPRFTSRCYHAGEPPADT